MQNARVIEFGRLSPRLQKVWETKQCAPERAVCEAMVWNPRCNGEPRSLAKPETQIIWGKRQAGSRVGSREKPPAVLKPSKVHRMPQIASNDNTIMHTDDPKIGVNTQKQWWKCSRKCAANIVRKFQQRVNPTKHNLEKQFPRLNVIEVFNVRLNTEKENISEIANQKTTNSRYPAEVWKFFKWKNSDQRVRGKRDTGYMPKIIYICQKRREGHRGEGRSNIWRNMLGFFKMDKRPQLTTPPKNPHNANAIK